MNPMDSTMNATGTVSRDADSEKYYDEGYYYGFGDREMVSTVDAKTAQMQDKSHIRKILSDMLGVTDPLLIDYHSTLKLLCESMLYMDFYRRAMENPNFQEESESDSDTESESREKNKGGKGKAKRRKNKGSDRVMRVQLRLNEQKLLQETKNYGQYLSDYDCYMVKLLMRYTDETKQNHVTNVFSYGFINKETNEAEFRDHDMTHARDLVSKLFE